MTQSYASCTSWHFRDLCRMRRCTGRLERLNFLHILCLRSLLTLLGLKFDLVSLSQRAKAAACYGSLMDEDIFAAVVGCDETESLGIVEPLYRSLHCVLLG